MPDISKLNELSEIFDISIDELLGNNRVTNIIKDILSEKEVDLKEIEKEELENLLPIVKPEQFKKSFNDFEGLDFNLLIMLAPFMDEDEVDQIVLSMYEKDESVKIVAFAPFMSDQAINDLFIKIVENEQLDKAKLFGFVPFVDENIIDKVALDIYEKNGMGLIAGLAPFMSNEGLKAIASKAKENNKYQELIMIAPFLDDLKDTIMELFKNKK